MLLRSHLPGRHTWWSIPPGQRWPLSQLMQSVGFATPTLHVLQCHAGVHPSAVWAAQCGGGGGPDGARPVQLTISLLGSPDGVRKVLPAYCIDVEDAGSGLSHSTLYGVPAVMHVLLNQFSLSGFGASTPDASFTAHWTSPQPMSGRMKRLP